MERFEELAPVYALGALPRSERLWFEAYLAEHPELNAEVEDLGSVADLLALAPPDQEPPPGLRRNVLEGVGAPREVVSDMAARRAETTRRLSRPGALAAAAAAFIAVIGLLVWNLALQEQNEDLRGEIAERQTFEMEGSGLASGADGEVLLRGEDGAVLVANELPPAPEGQIYETWVIRDGMPEPAGLFESRNGDAASPVEGPLQNAEAVAVTLEPEGGSPMPTSDPILVAPLA